MKKIILIMTLGLVSISCEKMMIGDVLENVPERNFQQMWNKFDSHYGLFLVKNIDWEEQYEIHLPQAQNAQSEVELYEIITEMLAVLNDKHVSIYTTNSALPDFNGVYNGPIPAQEDFYFPVIKNNYLSSYSKLSEEVEFGTLEANIGYIHFSSFKDDLTNYQSHMDKILNQLENSKAIIIDIRDHTGGSDHISKYVSGRFAKEKKLFMTSKKRNGPNHNDFESMYSWYVEPDGTKQYLKPIVLLTTTRTISAGETFTLAMRENNKVVQMGDTTAGAFSDEVFFELMNGWIYSISVGDYRASDGNSYEGIGIAPKIFIQNQKSDLEAGVDKVLEEAIKFLN